MTLIAGRSLGHFGQRIAHGLDQAVAIADRIGYPVLVRPSYVLGGRGMETCFDAESLRRYMSSAVIASELADDDKARAMIKILELPYQIARPFMTSSGIPSDRLAALRKAFMATAADAMFLAEAQKARIDVSPLSGEEVARLTSEIAQSPAAAIEHMRKLLGSDSPDNR